MPDNETKDGARRRRSEITTFYAPFPLATDGLITLDEDQARHARTVCRFHKGDRITVVDGEGSAHFCEAITVTPGKFVCRVFKSVKNWGEPPVEVDLAAGLSTGSKFDWTCEKATELGAAGIIPFVSERSTVKVDDAAAAKRKIHRYQRLALAAMKQSLRSLLPRVETISTLAQVIETFGSYHRVLLADPTRGSISFDKAAELISPARKILLIVGPESGFSLSELESLRDHDAVSVSLGPRRLRTETAAITFLSRVMGVFEV